MPAGCPFAIVSVTRRPTVYVRSPVLAGGSNEGEHIVSNGTPPLNTDTRPPTVRTPRMRRRRTVVALLLAVAIVAPAAAAAAARQHHDPLDVPRLSWSDCGDDLQCATASVPLDYDRPSGTHISLSLARLPATDQAHRIGTLFVNNGGPGNSVIDFMHGDVHDVVPAGVQARFDIVGFDPRGVGASTPVRCFADAAAQQAFFGELPAFPVSAPEISQATKAARELGRWCRIRNGDLLDHVSTGDVARDLDLLRRAVGDDQLTFAGYSYGGLIGLTYAQLYPDRVGAALLDGSPDPVGWTGGVDRQQPFSVRLGSQGAASEALRFFLRSCQVAGPERCAFAAADTTAKFDALMARLLAGPITADLPSGPLGPGGPTTLTYAFVADGLRGGLQFPPIWGDLAGLLQVTFAASGDAPPVSDTPPSAGAGGDEYDNSHEALFAVSCSETHNPSNPKRWIDAAAVAERDAPYFGADFAWLSLPCATWPARADDAIAGTFDAKTANPLLFLNSRFDAASPLSAATAMAARTPGARLLTVEGAGHPASFIPNQCVADAISAYLIEHVVPAAGAACQAEFEPFGL
jgi:pimeloyl-ACP methyl ester carboxylesterase